MEEFNLDNEKIIDVNVEEEIKQSFLDYSMSVTLEGQLLEIPLAVS